MPADYLPGYGPVTSAMLTARTAATRAAFLPPLRGARVLDVGCGPGTITAGLTAAGVLVALDRAADHLGVARDALPTDGPPWVVGRGSVYALPLATGCIDLAFAHALFEHLTDPPAALAELRRVLRPGGALALVSSDWSGARIEPDSPTARRAVEGYRTLRRRTGADPDAGARLAGWVAAAGFVVRHEQAHHRQDMPAHALARYVRERLAADPAGAALDAARRWAAEPVPAAVAQRWVEILAVPR